MFAPPWYNPGGGVWSGGTPWGGGIPTGQTPNPWSPQGLPSGAFPGAATQLPPELQGAMPMPMPSPNGGGQAEGQRKWMGKNKPKGGWGSNAKKPPGGGGDSDIPGAELFGGGPVGTKLPGGGGGQGPGPWKPPAGTQPMPLPTPNGGGGGGPQMALPPGLQAPPPGMSPGLGVRALPPGFDPSMGGGSYGAGPRMAPGGPTLAPPTPTWSSVFYGGPNKPLSIAQLDGAVGVQPTGPYIPRDLQPAGGFAIGDMRAPMTAQNFGGDFAPNDYNPPSRSRQPAPASETRPSLTVNRYGRR